MRLSLWRDCRRGRHQFRTRGARHLLGQGASHLSPARFGHDADGDPRGQRDRHPALAGRGCEPLCGIPPKHLRAGDAAGQADDDERQRAEARGAQPGPGDAGLQRLDRVAAREESRQTLRPVGQARERHGNAADDEHRQEDALPERLHRRHGVGHHRNHEPEPDEGERHQRERHEEIDRVPRHRHAQAHGQRELKKRRDDEEQIPRRDRSRHQRRRRHRREPVAPPHAPFPLAHHRGRQPEARAAERRDRQQFAHVTHERHLLEAIEHPERDEEDRRKQIAVEQRHLVPRVQAQADRELVEEGGHGLAFSLQLSAQSSESGDRALRCFNSR